MFFTVCRSHFTEPTITMRYAILCSVNMGGFTLTWVFCNHFSEFDNLQHYLVCPPPNTFRLPPPEGQEELNLFVLFLLVLGM